MAQQRSNWFRVVALSVVIIDSVFALALAVVGLWAAQAGSAGVERVGSRDEFATGMFLGVFAWAGWIAALLVAGMALVAWRIYRRLPSSSGRRLADVVGIAVALVPIVIVIALVGRVLLNG